MSCLDYRARTNQLHKYHHSVPPSAPSSARSKRRVLRDFHLDKISCVDKPCQEMALVTLLKRAPRDKEDTPMPKSSTLSELEEQLRALEKRIKALDDDSNNGDDEDDENDGDNDDDENEDDWSEAGNRKGISKLFKRHKFEALVDWLATENNISRTDAASRARKDYPDVFASYQNDYRRPGARPGALDYLQQPVSPRSREQLDTGGGRLTKSLPSYDALVQAEIRKGCNYDVAMQRVSLMHPEVNASHIQKISKGAGSVGDYMAAVDKYMQNHGCERTVAMREIRKRMPATFAKYQNI